MEFLENFVYWLAEKVVEETNKFKTNPTAYNDYIRQNLPWAKRLGKIKRQDFWNILGDETIRPDIGLGEGLINKLKAILAEMKEIEKPLLQEMTSSELYQTISFPAIASTCFPQKTESSIL